MENKQFATMCFSALPGLHFTIEDQIAEGDKVVTLWTARGAHKGPFMGIPSAGKQAVVTGIAIDHFATVRLWKTGTMVMIWACCNNLVLS
jgi:predicted ester cyclase